MKNICLGITVVFTSVMAAGFGASAQSTPPESAPRQYFVYNLPAGASLISSPLDTGTGLGVNTFFGFPAGWPLFFGWDSYTQSFVPADQAPAGLGHGFWTYLPTPTTLAAAGQPFNYLRSVTMHVPPGWHLFGVPYLSGVNWSDFKVYFAGNPIGLDAAIANGWIDSGFQTMEGGKTTSLISGQPFQPGSAYWVHTTVPLDLRADAAPSTAARTTLSAGTVTERMPTGIAAETTATSVPSSTAGWMASISSSLGDVGEAAGAFAEGNVFSGTFDLLAGGFDLLEHAMDPNSATPEPNDQLTEIDTKLDTLLGDVSDVSQQLTGMEQAVAGLGQEISSETALGEPMTNAETWLHNNYNDPFSVSSRQWARWRLAGCSVTATACPEASNPVTAANLSAFKSQYLTKKGTASMTADFPLWWAESVVGGWTPEVFQDGGGTAKSYVTEIWQGLTAGITSPATTKGNGLMTYMQYMMSSSGCANDPSYSDAGGSCDLYRNVYQPVEAYFAQAMADQTQLVAAIVESYGVLTQENQFPAGAAQTFMTGVTQQINQEAEALLQVAEQIALYRAADGVHDWNTFPSTDAGQLLSRADFVVMQLAGNNYQPNPQAGWFNPPWPLLGGLTVGRVFYAHGETPLGANATRDACPQADGAFCGAPAFQISENVSTQRTVQNGPPHFLWAASSGNIAQGTVYRDWTIQRIVPSWQQPGMYLVNSTQPGSDTQKSRGGAPLDVRLFNQNYSDQYPPQVNTESASLNSAEGAVGPYGLFLPAPYWAWSGSGNNKAHQSPAPSYGSQNCAVSVNYINDANDSHGTVSFNWSESQQIQFTMPTGYTHVKVTWPAQATISAGAAPLPNSGSYAQAAKPYWQSMTFSQQILTNGNVVNPNGSYTPNPCSAPNGSGNFNSCTYSNTNQSWYSGQILTPGQGEQLYTLKATYSDTVVPTTTVGCTNPYGCFVGVNPTSGSHVTWTLTFPSLTILP
ncbi:MAG: hypothetical protein U0Q18_25880 [Bryobacteraceae bacterium]